jgi:polyisoprenoid-binding protein YceI
MKHHTAVALLVAATTSLTPFALRAEAQAPAPTSPVPVPVEVTSGTATFDASTNISAINVHGKSTNLQARAAVKETGDVLTIERVDATLPVKTLTTGMGLRDEHMRKYVFTTSDGQTPDVKFTSEKAACAAGNGGESTCQVSGQLAIRGTTRPFAIALKVKKAGDGYRAAGDGIVKLSSYGIERPSQLGVTTADDVKLHLEFTAKPSASQVAARSGGFR